MLQRVWAANKAFDFRCWIKNLGGVESKEPACLNPRSCRLKPLLISLKPIYETAFVITFGNAGLQYGL